MEEVSRGIELDAFVLADPRAYSISCAWGADQAVKSAAKVSPEDR